MRRRGVGIPPRSGFFLGGGEEFLWFPGEASSHLSALHFEIKKIKLSSV